MNLAPAVPRKVIVSCGRLSEVIIPIIAEDSRIVTVRLLG
jgi:hypothetical protein